MKAKKILSLVLAMMLVFALAAPAMAYTPNNSAYRQVAIASAPTIPANSTVYLSIVSNEVSGSHIGRYDLPISISTADQYDVADILVLAHAQYPALTFYYDSDTVLTGASQRLYGVKDTTVSTTQIFGPNEPEYDKIGWMFRIDNQFPLLNSADWPSNYNEDTKGPIGATIEQAYVEAGQHIFLYFAGAQTETNATHYVKISNFAHTSGSKTVTFQLFDCYCWYDTEANDFYWHIEPYDEELASSSFTATLNGTAVSLSYYSGCFHIYNKSITANQNYTLVINPQYHSIQSTISPYTSYSAPSYTGTGCTFIG